MAYQINRYNNTLLTTVEDGQVDQSTDLIFIGKNYSGYGEIQNENFLFLLENFSGSQEPPRPLSGQLWFDSSNSKLKFYDGYKWRTTGGAEVGTDEPSGLVTGDFWWDDANNQLYVYNGSTFILIGPQSTGEGITQMQSREVIDTAGNTRSIITAVINDEVIYIISANEFDLSDVNPIPGFDRIKKGLTLINTKLATNGVTTPPDWWFWGTASNAAKLGGIDADQYITQVDPTFNSAVNFPDAGITIGDSLDLRIYIEQGNMGVIENIIGVNNEIRFKATDSTGTSNRIATISNIGLVPAINSTGSNGFNLGSTSLKWNEVHAVSLKGVADSAIALRVGSVNMPASTSATPETVAVRDSNGDISAVLFKGTATQARYADLAEKYTTEVEYAVGTAMAICEHSVHEACPADCTSIVIGVISENPAYLMNADITGQAIALKGRVPVRVIGPVTKGQKISVARDGVCEVNGEGPLVGVALETNLNDEEKLVECVLKV